MRDNGAGDKLPIWGVRPAGPTRLSMKEERNPKTPRAFRAKEEECNTGEHLGGPLSFSSLTEFESQKVPEWYLRPMQGGLQSKTPTHLGGGAGQRPPASAQRSESSSGQTLGEAPGQGSLGGAGKHGRPTRPKSQGGRRSGKCRCQGESARTLCGRGHGHGRWAPETSGSAHLTPTRAGNTVSRRRSMFLS